MSLCSWAWTKTIFKKNKEIRRPPKWELPEYTGLLWTNLDNSTQRAWTPVSATERWAWLRWRCQQRLFFKLHIKINEVTCRLHRHWSVCCFSSQGWIKIPVSWASSSWQTQACCWLVGTALSGQILCSSVYQVWQRWSHRRLFWLRETGRQVLPQPWAPLWTQSRASSHPRKIRMR